jgi:hypothetical protein
METKVMDTHVDTVWVVEEWYSLANGDCEFYGPFKTADEAHSYATSHGTYSKVIARYRLVDGVLTGERLDIST